MGVWRQEQFLYHKCQGPLPTFMLDKIVIYSRTGRPTSSELFNQFVVFSEQDDMSGTGYVRRTATVHRSAFYTAICDSFPGVISISQAPKREQQFIRNAQ